MPCVFILLNCFFANPKLLTIKNGVVKLSAATHELEIPCGELCRSATLKPPLVGVHGSLRVSCGLRHQEVLETMRDLKHFTDAQSE